MIYWSTFTWEAFATVATGILAVAAAAWVGRRQADIAARQTDILARQVALDELKLRTDLFDRRMVVYVATERLLARVLTEFDEKEREVERAFVLAMDQAGFLFRPAVKVELRAIYKKFRLYRATQKRLLAGLATADEEHEHFTWLSVKADHLSDVFGDELRLAMAEQLPPHR